MPQTLLLKDNQALLQALLRSHGNSVVFTFDQQLKCLAVNTTQPLVFGKSLDTFIENNIAEIFAPDIYSQLTPLLMTALNGQSATGDVSTFTESYTVIVEPLNNDESIVGGVAILKPNATASDQTNSDDVNYWNAIWRVIPDMLFRVNREGIFVDFRVSEHARLYRPPQEFLGKTLDELLPPDLAIRSQNALATVFDVGIPVSFRYSLPDGTGQDRFSEARFVLAGVDDALIIVRDITEQHQHEAAIRHSERRFRQLTETAVDLIATHDMDGKILYINPAGITMLELDLEKIDTSNILDFIPPEHVAEVLARKQERKNGNREMFRYELEIITAQQQRKTLEVSSSPISSADSIDSVLLIARDITERKHTEKQILAQAKQIDLFLQNTHDGFIISTRDGEILDVNPAYCVMSGRTPESLLGINLKDITVGLTKTELTANRKQLYEKGSVRFRTQHRHQDGHLIDLEISVYLVSDEEDREYIFMRDTTAENTAIATTEHSAKRLAILHNIDAAILSAENEFEIAEASLGHIQHLVPCLTSSVMIFDYDDGVARIVASYRNGTYKSGDLPEIPTVPLDHIRPIDDLIAGKPRLSNDMSGVSAKNTSYEAMRQLGIQSFITVPILTDGQLIGGLTLTHQDKNAFNDEDVQVAQEVAQSLSIAIKQVRLNEQVRLYAAELEELVTVRTEELQQANDRLLELDHLKSKFVSDVSHELRTPVNNLMMRLHLLEHDTPDQQAAHMSYMKDQIGYLTELVEDILKISRLEVDKGSINFHDVDINELVRQVYHHHSPSAAKRKLDMKQELSEKLPVVIGDSASLIEAFGNLVDNAINYTEEGVVFIRTRFDERTRHVILEVEDTGMGIDPVDLPHIFDRFYRGSRVAKSDIRGTGLGLGIAAEIVKLHRGRIEVQSVVGKGSCFTVRLPALLDDLIDK